MRYFLATFEIFKAVSMVSVLSKYYAVLIGITYIPAFEG